MATNGTLQYATNYVQTGLGTLTFTVPSTLNGVAVSSTPFTVNCQVTFPQAVAQGSGSGSGYDTGKGVTGGTQGIGQGSNLVLGNGGTGLGFDGSVTDGASGMPTAAALVLSTLSIVVKLNGSTKYTAPTIAGNQEALQFKTSFPVTAADSITVVFSSALTADNVLQAIKANVSVTGGE